MCLSDEPIAGQVYLQIGGKKSGPPSNGMTLHDKDIRHTERKRARSQNSSGGSGGGTVSQNAPAGFWCSTQNRPEHHWYQIQSISDSSRVIMAPTQLPSRPAHSACDWLVAVCVGGALLCQCVSCGSAGKHSRLLLLSPVSCCSPGLSSSGAAAYCHRAPGLVY